MMKNICVVFGGASTEYDVSLRSATTIIKNLKNHTVHMLGITRSGRWLYYTGDLESIISDTWHTHDCQPAVISPCTSVGGIVLNDGSRIKIDCIFPALHGKYGEDGCIQGLFSLAGIPFVGAGVLASAACMDKSVTKLIAQSAGVAQAAWTLVMKNDIVKNPEEAATGLLEKFSLPVFVKPANSGSSVGVSKAKTADQLKEALLHACQFDSRVIVEENIVGAEVEVAVLGNDSPIASACGQIIAGEEFYSYDDKYINQVSQTKIPADISPQSAEKARELAVEIFKKTGCVGLARVDFFVTADGRVIFNEINTLPGFTSISMYPKLFEHCGIETPKLVDMLVDFAVEG